MIYHCVCFITDGVSLRTFNSPSGLMTVTGWGRTTTSGGETVSKLREIDLPFTNVSMCEDFTGQYSRDHMFCLGNYSALQRQNAVFAYFTSKQILPSGLAW